MDDDRKKIWEESGFVVQGGDALDDKREIIGRTMSRFARMFLDNDEFEIVLTNAGNALTVRQKLLVFLLARKILEDMERIESENTTPSELEVITGMPGGTIRPILSKLVDARLVRKNDSGYFIPNYSIDNVIAELEE